MRFEVSALVANSHEIDVSVHVWVLLLEEFFNHLIDSEVVLVRQESHLELSDPSMFSLLL